MRKLLVLVVLCAACLGGKRPNYQYYVLTPVQPPGPQTPAPTTSERALAIADVTIPGYLDREQIATRTFDHQLVYSRTDRWAEPLDQAIARTLREDLAMRLTSSGIEVQSRGGAPTYDLHVDVLRFERSGTNRVELWARWTLRSDSGVLDSGETRVRVPTAAVDSNAMAAALSEAIARMSTELAVRVQKVDVVVAREQGTGTRATRD